MLECTWYISTRITLVGTMDIIFGADLAGETGAVEPFDPHARMEEGGGDGGAEGDDTADAFVAADWEMSAHSDGVNFLSSRKSLLLYPFLNKKEKGIESDAASRESM